MQPLFQEATDFLDSQGLGFISDPSQVRNKYVRFQSIDRDDREHLEVFLRIFKKEFSKYPVPFLRASYVKKIGLVKRLEVDNTDTGKFIPLFGTTDPRTKSLIMDVTYVAEEPNYCRRVIHHELFHLLELNLHGAYLFKDPEWLRAIGSFKYLGTGADAHKIEGFREKAHPEPGFVSRYAMFSIDEDRAETYMYLMDGRPRPVLARWCKEDPILRKKRALLEKMLKETGLNPLESFKRTAC